MYILQNKSRATIPIVAKSARALTVTKSARALTVTKSARVLTVTKSARAFNLQKRALSQRYKKRARSHRYKSARAFNYGEGRAHIVAKSARFPTSGEERPSNHSPVTLTFARHSACSPALYLYVNFNLSSPL
jgi:hypothetical protein